MEAPLPPNERERAENELNTVEMSQALLIQRESEARVQAVMESVADAIITFAEDGVVESFNPAAERIFGYAAGEVIGRQVELLIAEPYRTEVTERLSSYLPGSVKEIVRREVAGCRKSGELFPVDLTLSEMTLNGQRRFIAVARDITKRKRAEEALQEAYQFNADVISNVQEGVIVYDRDLRYLLWNPFMERLTGVPFERVKGKSALELFPHLTQLEVYDLLHRALRGETVRSTDVPFRPPGTDQPRWITGSYAPYRDGNGNIMGVIALIGDITERKQAEDARQQSEERYRSLVETSPDAIALIDLDGVVLMANRQVAELLGYENPDELIGTSIFDLVAPETRLRMLEDMQRAIEIGSVKNLEYTLLKRDGSGVPVEGSGSAVLDREGKPIAITAVARDISERKRGEELRARLFAREQAARTEAEAAEAELAAVVEQIPSGVMAVDREGRVTFINEVGMQILGRFPSTSIPVAEQAAAYEPREPVTNRPLAQDEMPIPRALAGETVQGHESVFRRPDDGQEVWIQVSAVPVRDADDQITGAVAVFSDVTRERRLLQGLKASEEALRQSEERLARVIETLAEGLVIVDDRGNITFANPAAEEILGLTRSDITGRMYDDPIWKNMTLEGRPLPQEDLPLARVFRTGQLVRGIEHALEHPDGRRIVLSVSAAPLRDAKGVVVGGVATFSDITERKRTEEALRESETRFRAIWDISADAMALSDPEGIVTRANRAYFQLYGYQPEEVLGKNFAVIFPEEMREQAAEEYRRVFQQEEIAPMVESLVRRADGTERIVESRYDFLIQDGKRVAMLSTIRDITERKRIEAALRQSEEQTADILARERAAVERLRQIERWRTAFLRIMAHELRTPLGHIAGFADLLTGEADRLSERGQRYLRNIRTAAANLEVLGRRSFDLMQLHADEVQLDREPIKVHHLIESVLDSYRETAEAKNIQLIKREPGEPLEIVGDVQRLDQVLDILLDNALKFTPPGGRIEVRAERRRERVDLAVQDSGPGVPEEMREYIFAGQAEEVLTRRHGGTGLSLLMARRIAELHGGELRLEPTEQGACFVLSLPMAPSAAEL